MVPPFSSMHGTAISLVKNQHFVIPRKQHLMPIFVGLFHGTANFILSIERQDDL
jgi:hypothetical protein